MANKWVTHDFSNYPPGGPLSSTYLADADEFNQNYEDICDAVGARYVRGVNCENKNSTATTCEIWLRADGGAKDLCDADWYALIYYDASNVWETTVSVSGSDCYIVFGDSQLKNPATSGVSDYGAAAFIDALHIMLFPKKMMLPKDWVITTSGAGGGLSTAEIYHESEPLSTFIADVKGRLDTICQAEGGLVASAVDSTAIAGDEAVVTTSSVNLLAGGSLEHYGDQHDLLYRVEKVGDGGFEIVDIETYPEYTDGSKRAQKVAAEGSNVGIALPLSPNFCDSILAGKEVAVTFRVRSDTAASLDVGCYDNVSGYQMTTATELTAGDWATVTATATVGVGASLVKAVVRSNQECIFYVARGQMNIGDKCFGFSISPDEDAAQILMDTTQDNLFYNGGFERWTLTTQPDGWFAVGTPAFSTDPTGVMPEGTGNKLCNMTLQANDGIGQYLGLVTDSTCGEACVNENILVGLVRGSKVCASVDMMFDTTATGEITLVLGDYDGTTSDEEEFAVTPLVEEMRRFTVYKEITSNAKQIYFKILNKEAGQRVLSIDNAMLHVGEFPLMFKPSAGWREMRWDFSDVQAFLDEDMEAAGITSGEYPMPGEAGAYLMLKAGARCLTGPVGDDNDYRLYVDTGAGAEDPNGIVVTIADGNTEGENHVTSYDQANDKNHQCESYQKAPRCTAAAEGTSDALDIILSVWGYYYAS